MMTQTPRDAARTEIQNTVRHVVRGDQGGSGSSGGASSPAVWQVGDGDGPQVVRAIPRDGGQIIVDRQGGHTVITSAALPPDVWRVIHSAEQTALGLLGILAAIVILGPFVRMYARRSERTAAMASSTDALALQQQIQHLQQSVDAMCVEVERISESQRFQSKLLFEKKGSEPAHDHIS